MVNEAPGAVHKPRDPRFNGLSGAVDLAQVVKAYSFVDEQRAKDLAELHESLKVATIPEDREAIVERIHLLRDQERVRSCRRRVLACRWGGGRLLAFSHLFFPDCQTKG